MAEHFCNRFLSVRKKTVRKNLPGLKEKPLQHVTNCMKDPWLAGLNEVEGIQLMPDLPCHYIFSSLPQERKVRYGLDQDSTIILTQQ